MKEKILNNNLVSNSLLLVIQFFILDSQGTNGALHDRPRLPQPTLHFSIKNVCDFIMVFGLEN
jgi:hypothetical protein